MAVKLRLQRRGRKAAPFYHIVVADSRSPRDGKFIEKIGTYNPLTVPAAIELDRDRAAHWISVGAQPTDTVNAILRLKGVLYAKHLQKGVAKGAFDQAKADEMLAKWIEEKENHIEKRREETKEAKKKLVAKVDGTAKVKVKPVPPPVEVEAAPEEEAEVAEAVAVTEDAAPEADAVAEAVAEEAVAEEVAVATEVEAVAEEVAVATEVEAVAEEVEAVPTEVEAVAETVTEAVAEEAAPEIEAAAEAVTEEGETATEEKTEE